MKLLSAVAILGWLLVSSSSAQTGKLKALIIGNGGYTHLNNLEPEPANDANRMASVLQGVGVKSADETVLFDLGKERLEKAIEQFARTLQPEDTAIFYFSGHGYTIEGSGFLAPIDMVVTDNITKAEARDAGYPLFQLFHQLGRAGQRVIILDACRNDPNLEKQVFKDINGDSFRVAPLKSEEPPVGTIVAFATSAGAKSALGSSDNLSFYTHYLVMNLSDRPATLMEALEKTVSDVAQASKNAQIPALYLEGSPPIVLSKVGPSGNQNVMERGISTQPNLGEVTPEDSNQARFNECIEKKVEGCMTACEKFVVDYHYTVDQWNCAKFACVYDDRNLTDLSKTEKKIYQPGTNYYSWTSKCRASIY